MCSTYGHHPVLFRFFKKKPQPFQDDDFRLVALACVVMNNSCSVASPRKHPNFKILFSLPTSETRVPKMPFFTQIEQPQHKLHKLLPNPRTTTHNTRCRTRYSLSRVKTNRTKNCFINWCLFNQNNSQ